MTMIACPECRKQISSKATTFPHCGSPLSPGITTYRSKLVIAGLVVLVFAGILALQFSRTH